MILDLLEVDQSLLQSTEQGSVPPLPVLKYARTGKMRETNMADAPATIRGDVIFDAEGRNTGGFRNDITVRRPGGLPSEVYDLPTDEGPGHGGNSSAPYPLAYFTSALTACVMVQLRAFARRLKIEVADIAVDTRCHWERVQQGGSRHGVASLYNIRALRVRLLGMVQ